MTDWADAAEHVQVLIAMRRSRRRRFFRLLAAFVGLPTAATFLYMSVVASPRYTSEFQATYQTYRPPESLSSGLVQSFAGTSQNNTVDLGTILYQYIRSPSLLQLLNQQLHLRTYFSNPKIDLLSRLDKTASNEATLRYYRRRVSVSEGLGGYLTVKVQAFDPKFARALAGAVIADCDAMTDQMTARARADEIHVAENEVAREQDRVEKARLSLAEFQNRHGDVDPQRTASQLGDVAAKLETDLAGARADLAASRYDLASSSPIVQQLRARVSSLEQALKDEQLRLANSGGRMPYATILEQYSALQTEQEFAKNAYLAAQQGLAVARADVARKQAYLVDFAPPTEPDQPSVYLPLVYTSSVFFGSLILFGFVSLLAGALRDQAGL
jgi:capsular polysaccharide transport system permease protein